MLVMPGMRVVTAAALLDRVPFVLAVGLVPLVTLVPGMSRATRAGGLL